MRRAFGRLPELVDIDSDVQDRGRQTALVLDRDAIARLGLSVRAIDATLNNAFGQRQVGVIYNPLNQYRVVLEVASAQRLGPAALQRLYVPATGGAQVPLSSLAQVVEKPALLSITHVAQYPAVTLSFNPAPGFALGQAVRAIEAGDGWFAALSRDSAIIVDASGTVRGRSAPGSDRSFVDAAAARDRLFIVDHAVGMEEGGEVRAAALLRDLDPRAGGLERSPPLRLRSVVRRITDVAAVDGGVAASNGSTIQMLEFSPATGP